MPINRAPFNALVDDTGNGTSGSIWNKAAIQSVLLDPIDVMPWTYIEVPSLVQPGPDWNPFNAIVGNTVINVSLVESVTIYGIKPAVAPWTGQRIVIHVISAATVLMNLYHDHPSPSPGCKLRLPKSPAMAINGFWSFAEFVWSPYSGDAGGWMLTAYGNGIGATA